jgi:hypothetical protein
VTDFTHYAEGDKPFGPEHAATIYRCPDCGLNGLGVRYPHGSTFIHAGELLTDGAIATDAASECRLEDPRLERK